MEQGIRNDSRLISLISSQKKETMILNFPSKTNKKKCSPKQWKQVNVFAADMTCNFYKVNLIQLNFYNNKNAIETCHINSEHINLSMMDMRALSYN